MSFFRPPIFRTNVILRRTQSVRLEGCAVETYFASFESRCFATPQDEDGRAA